MLVVLDILPALKLRRFWVQTTVAVSYRLTLSRPTDNALPVWTILSASRQAKDGGSKPIFSVTKTILDFRFAIKKI
jgi:hypothetical protein